MFLLIEALMSEIATLSPEFLLLFGAPELPFRRRRLTVRRGAVTELVEA